MVLLAHIHCKVPKCGEVAWSYSPLVILNSCTRGLGILLNAPTLRKDMNENEKSSKPNVYFKFWWKKGFRTIDREFSPQAPVLEDRIAINIKKNPPALAHTIRATRIFLSACESKSKIFFFYKTPKLLRRIADSNDSKDEVHVLFWLDFVRVHRIWYIVTRVSLDERCRWTWD